MRASIVVATFLVVYLANLTAGSLAVTAAGSTDVLDFDAVRDAEFPPGVVRVDRGAPGGGVLVLKVAVLGDAPPAGFEEARRYLERELGVRVVEDPEGAPLFFTNRDLAIEGSPSPVGAAISRGVVVETRDPALAPCVVAHELGHLLGLDHHDHPANLMHARCGHDRLDKGFVDEDQRREMQRIRAMHLEGGLSSSGAEWAFRDA